MSNTQRLRYEGMFSVGQRVEGLDYNGNVFTGIIYSIKGNNRATIRRDDKMQGDGDFIKEDDIYGWIVIKSRGRWSYYVRPIELLSVKIEGEEYV